MEYEHGVHAFTGTSLAAAQIAVTMHCLALRIGAKTRFRCTDPGVLAKPALWRIFKTDLGILLRLITAKAKLLFQLLEVLLVHFEGDPSGQS